MAGPSPVPFSVGINSLTHHGVVAYESFNEATILDVSTGTPVILQQIGGDPTAPIGTGTTPGIFVDERLDWALVTPGGGGAHWRCPGMERASLRSEPGSVRNRAHGFPEEAITWPRRSGISGGLDRNWANSQLSQSLVVAHSNCNHAKSCILDRPSRQADTLGITRVPSPGTPHFRFPRRSP